MFKITGLEELQNKFGDLSKKAEELGLEIAAIEQGSTVGEKLVEQHL